MADSTTGSTPGSESGSVGEVQNFFEGINFDGGSSSSAPKEESSTTQTQTQPPAQQPNTTQQSGTTQQTQQTQQQAPATSTSVPALPVQSSVSLTPAQLAELLSTARGTENNSAAQIKEPTPEEIDAKFNVIRPKEEDIATVFRGGPEGATKLTEMLHGTAKMGATIASHHVMGEMKKLHEWVSAQLKELSPAREVAQQRQMEQHTQTFFKSFPQWTQEHVPVLKHVYEKLLSQNFNADGKLPPDQVYAKVNEEATNLMRVINPQFGAAGTTGAPAGQSGSGNQSSSSRPATGQSQMTQLPSGGAGGSGANQGSSSGKKNGVEALFS